jgi:toxin ParE1/3/4
MKIKWSVEALEDLQSLGAFIAKDNPSAATAVAMRIVEAIEDNLPLNPHIGRPGRVAGTRELVIPNTPYIVPYRIQTGTVHILRIYHGARRWPDQF